MKIKTNKSALKRFKIKKKVISRKSINRTHLLRKKSSSRLRKLFKKSKLKSCEKSKIKALAPYN